MTKFTINPRVVYSGDTCYVTIAAFIVISQSIYLLMRAAHFRDVKHDI